MSKSSTITDETPAGKGRLRFDPPIHPGEILRAEFMRPLGLSSGRLARALGVPRTRIERVAREELGITADTALRLARYFGTTPELWLNLQTSYDLGIREKIIADDLSRIEVRQVA
jgi:addiction module HigA family antidote